MLSYSFAFALGLKKARDQSSLTTHSISGGLPNRHKNLKIWRLKGEGCFSPKGLKKLWLLMCDIPTFRSTTGPTWCSLPRGTIHRLSTQRWPLLSRALQPQAWPEFPTFSKPSCRVQVIPGDADPSQPRLFSTARVVDWSPRGWFQRPRFSLSHSGSFWIPEKVTQIELQGHRCVGPSKT